MGTEVDEDRTYIEGTGSDEVVHHLRLWKSVDDDDVMARCRCGWLEIGERMADVACGWMQHIAERKRIQNLKEGNDADFGTGARGHNRSPRDRLTSSTT